MPLTAEERRLQIINAMKNAPLSTPTDPTLVAAPTRRPIVPTTSAEAALDAPPPIPSEGVKSNMPPVRVTFGSKGLSGVDALTAQRGGMQEHPFSKVTTNEQGQAEIAPPKPERHGFKGTLKNIGEGVLSGLAMADPDNPNAILGSAIGGAAAAAANRSAGPKLRHRFEMNQLDNDIARGLKLEQEQTKLGGLKEEVRQRAGAPTDAEVATEATRINNERLALEDRKIKDAISKIDYEREQKRLDREAANLRNKTSSEATIEAARIRATGGPQAKPNTNLEEAKVKYDKAAEYWDEATKKEAEANSLPDDTYDNQQKKAQLRAEAEDLKKRTRKLQEDGDELKAKGSAVASPVAPSKTLDPAIEKKIRDAATAKGLDPNIAVQRALERP